MLVPHTRTNVFVFNVIVFYMWRTDSSLANKTSAFIFVSILANKMSRANKASRLNRLLIKITIYLQFFRCKSNVCEYFSCRVSQLRWQSASGLWSSYTPGPSPLNFHLPAGGSQKIVTETQTHIHKFFYITPSLAAAAQLSFFFFLVTRD